jgi:hypothetical protein
MQMRDYKNRLKQLQDERDEPSMWEKIAGGAVALVGVVLIFAIAAMMGA